MAALKKLKIRILSLITLISFIMTTVGAYAQQAPVTNPSPPLSNIGNLLGTNPEIQMLRYNLNIIENSLREIEAIAQPLYNKIAPSNMEAMTIGERIKAIINNTKLAVQEGVQSYRNQVNEWNAAHGITPNTSFEEELGIGLNQLGIEAGKMPLNGKGNAFIEQLKTIISAIKEKLQTIIAIIKAKITAVAQKIGIIKKDDASAKEPKKESVGKGELPLNADIQYADTFSGKLQKGIADGTQSAKNSLKSSFSFTNLAVTTTVAVGTNLAIQMIKGERPSFGRAARAVATLEFAGSVVGGALGAAGGHFTAGLVRAFMPGPIGALVGAVVPVMMGSAGAQIGSVMAGDLKNRRLSITRAIQSIDPVDLVGSSIGSTIGMALGAPIPILGPIVGGIVGGFIGSKVAKWIVGIFKGNKTISWESIFGRNTPVPTTIGQNQGGEISIGNFQGPLPTYTPDMPKGTITVRNEKTIQPSGVNLADIERKYYEAYLKYNNLVEQGNYEEAKKVYGELKAYSDQYNALKNATKTSGQ